MGGDIKTRGKERGLGWVKEVFEGRSREFWVESRGTRRFSVFGTVVEAGTR